MRIFLEGILNRDQILFINVFDVLYLLHDQNVDKIHQNQYESFPPTKHSNLFLSFSIARKKLK